MDNLNAKSDHIQNVAKKLKIIIQNKNMKDLPWVIWLAKHHIY